MRALHRAWLAALPLALLVPAASAQSGRLQAGPTLVEIGPQASSTSLRLRNSGDTTVASQVRIYAWDQAGGEDRLTPSDDLAVSPPIVEIAPGSEQIVRIVRTGAAASGHDRSYRVVVDELPPPEGSAASGVQLRMRYVIPAFVRAADASAPALDCAIEARGARLGCENRGGRAAQLGASRLVDDGGRSIVLNEGLFGYVLAGSRRVWDLPAAVAGADRSALRLETRINGEAITLALRTP